MSLRRIAERWMSARSDASPVLCAATAASDPHDPEAQHHAEHRAEHAVDDAEARHEQAPAHDQAETLERRSRGSPPPSSAPNSPKAGA